MDNTGLQPFIDSIERSLITASSYIGNAKVAAQKSGDIDMRTLLVATLANVDGALAMIAAMNEEAHEPTKTPPVARANAALARPARAKGTI